MSSIKKSPVVAGVVSSSVVTGKCISFTDEAWSELSVGDVIYAHASGGPFDFNDEFELPAHKISEGRNSAPIKVSFDGAESGGRVWFMGDDGNWIAIEGEDNARKAAAMLLAWADDTYRNKGDEQ